MACSIGFEPAKRRCSHQVAVLVTVAPYALAAINTKAYHRGAAQQSDEDEVHAGPAPSALTLFCMLSGSFMFAMIVLFCTLRLRCMDRRRRLPPKMEQRKTVITEEEVDRRCPVTPCAKSENPTTCVVCLLPVEDGELCRELQCGHTFHADCIMSWWMYKPRKSIRCPLCRQKQRKPTAKPHCSASKENGWDADDPEQPDSASSERDQPPTVPPTTRVMSRFFSSDDPIIAPGCLGSAEVEEQDV